MDVVSQSGQALRDLVSAMMSIERRPVEEVAFRKSVVEGEVSAQRKLASRLSSLRRLAQDFSAAGALSPLRGFSVDGLDSAPIRASASSTALSGSHQLEVHSLAQSHSIASQPTLGIETNLSALPTVEEGVFRFSIDQGASEPAEIAVKVAEGATNREVIRAVAEAINKADAGLSASVIRTSGSDVRLLVQSKEGGEASRIRGISDLDGGLMSALGLTGREVDGFHPATVQKPQDAVVTLDGLEIRSTSNSLEDVLSGVTLNLDAVTEGSVEFDVARDDEAVTAEVQKFIDGYNETLNELISLTRAADDNGQNRGILASATAFRSLRFSLRRELTGPVTLGERTVSLEQIGITADRDGKLTLNEASFTKALQSNPTLVEDLFSGEGGVAGRLEGLLDGYAKTGGILDQQVEASQRRVDLYTRRISSLEEGLGRREANLFSQLAQLQSAVGLLSSQQSYLSGVFASA